MPSLLTTFIKRVIPSGFRKALKRLAGIPETRLHGDWAILGSVGPLNQEHVVLDVGAHHGWFFHCWLDWCPKAEVHAFEPTAESFRVAQDLYGADPRVHLNQMGVGAERGELGLHILQESQVSNSFLPPNEQAWDSIEYRTGMVKERRVPVTSLDDYCRERGIESIYLLKVDVQGFELEVLKGAREILPRVDYIFVESGIQRLYKGAPSFAETFLEVESRGFHLMDLRCWHRGNRVLVETDMLFRRNELAPDIVREADRYYLHLT